MSVAIFVSLRYQSRCAPHSDICTEAV